METNEEILNRTIKMIKRYGIPKYTKTWKKIFSVAEKHIDKLTTEGFVNKLNYLIKKYYDKNSFIYDRSTEKKLINVGKLPNIKYTIQYGYIKISQVDAKNRKKAIAVIDTFIQTCMKKKLNMIIDLCDNYDILYTPIIEGFKKLFVTKERQISLLYSCVNLMKSAYYLTYDSSHEKKIEYTKTFERLHTHQDLMFDKKIALIVNENTKGYGEIIALIFQKRTNVKIFGKKTAGGLLCSHKVNINNKYNFVLTTGICRSFNEELTEDATITPDVITNKPMLSAKSFFM